MRKLANIGNLLKRCLRIYNNDLILQLKIRGFKDLRSSFLDVLFFICERNGPNIKDIAKSCGLKKQTMTGHLNELEKRGYIRRQVNPQDKREQHVFLTEFGQRFKVNLQDCISELEGKYIEVMGEVELDRTYGALRNFYEVIKE